MLVVLVTVIGFVFVAPIVKEMVSTTCPARRREELWCYLTNAWTYMAPFVGFGVAKLLEMTKEKD